MELGNLLAISSGANLMVVLGLAWVGFKVQHLDKQMGDTARLARKTHSRVSFIVGRLGFQENEGKVEDE